MEFLLLLLLQQLQLDKYFRERIHTVINTVHVFSYSAPNAIWVIGTRRNELGKVCGTYEEVFMG
jgi:hypothetical protein